MSTLAVFQNGRFHTDYILKRIPQSNLLIRAAGTICTLSVLLFFSAGCSPSSGTLVSPETPNFEESVTALYIYADERDLSRLFARDPRSDDRIDAFARFYTRRGRVEGLNGIRFRGNTSRFHPKKSYNIRFNNPQPLLFGSDRMNLNALYTDPSAMRERLVWELFRELGHPASGTRYFALHINNAYEGLGLHVQRVDETLLRRHGLNTNGTLVRDMTRRVGAAHQVEGNSAFGLNMGALRNPDELISTLFESRGNPDWGAVVGFLDWVYKTPSGPAFQERFEAEVDVNRFIDWLAVHYLIADVDAFGDDYWLYRGRATSDKWVVIPWDNDMSFGRNEREGLTPNRALGQYGRGLVQLSDYFAYEYPLDDAGWGNLMIQRFLETEGLRQQLFERLEVLMTEVFPPEYFVSQTKVAADQIRKYIEPESLPDGSFRYHERQHHGETGYFDDHIENLIDFIHMRYAFIRRQIQSVEGDAYSARGTIDGAGRYELTDAQGWTIAWLEVDESPDRCSVMITSEDFDLERGISQQWHIESDCEEVPVTLSLFYRNDVAPDGKANWYTGKDAIGNQRNLVIKDSNGQYFQTRTNPFSNKSVGKIPLRTGSAQLVLP